MVVLAVLVLVLVVTDVAVVIVTVSYWDCGIGIESGGVMVVFVDPIRRRW